MIALSGRDFSIINYDVFHDIWGGLNLLGQICVSMKKTIIYNGQYDLSLVRYHNIGVAK
jgi:hypothetical protein